MYNNTTKNYDILTHLGSGSFGNVYKARHRRTHEIHAIKVLDQQRLASLHVSVEYIQREVDSLKKLSHPNIVGYIDHTQEGDQHILATEYCDGPTLDKYLQTHSGEATTRILLKQLASALKYMTLKGVIHRDLKPQNILFSSNDPNAKLKLIDFGFSRIAPPSHDLMASMVGTPIYMAPELMRGDPYTTKSDLWSVGCIMFEMLTGGPIFTCTTQVELAHLHDTWTTPKIPSAVRASAECIELLCGLLRRDPATRIEWEDFFTHPFINSHSANLGDASINVRIEPISRTVNLNARDLDPTVPISVLKAQLLANSEDTEKYNLVTALVENRDGTVTEMSDDEPVSAYLDKILNASMVFLILPPSGGVADTAGEALETFLESTQQLSSVRVPSSVDGSLDQLQAIYRKVAGEHLEVVRFCEKAYQRSKALVYDRSMQLRALKVAISEFENQREFAAQNIISVKEVCQTPQEKDMQTLPAKVEGHIAELRNVRVETALPGLQGKSMLDCVGEDAIRLELQRAQRHMESGREIMESCDKLLPPAEIKGLTNAQKLLTQGNKLIDQMQATLGSVHAKQSNIETWSAKMDELLSLSEASWLGLPVEDPLRENLAKAHEHLARAHIESSEMRAFATEVRKQMAEMFSNMESMFVIVAGARHSVRSTIESLGRLGRIYKPQKKIIQDLQKLPEVVRRLVDQAAQVLKMRNDFETTSQNAASGADAVVQGMRNKVLEEINSFRKRENPFAKPFVDAVDKLAPPLAHVRIQPPDDQIRAAYQTQTAQLHAQNAHLYAQNAQLQQHIAQMQLQFQQHLGETAALRAENVALRMDAQKNMYDNKALRDHGADLARRWTQEQNGRKQCEQHIAFLEDQLRRQQIVHK